MTNNTGVQFHRIELTRQLHTYERIHDCLLGAPAMKGLLPAESWYLNGPISGAPPNGLYYGADRRQRYIPKPNPNDTSFENTVRYDAYVNRAIWYNVPSRTVQGLVGQVFLRDPESEMPDSLDPVKADADGAGNALIQVAKQTVRGVVAYGRCGLLVDYPTTGATPGETGATIQAASKADIDTGKIRPTITYYAPWDIINWRTERIGANVVVTMVVLREYMYGDGEDDFELIQYEQYRVLKLDADGKHVGELWSNYNETQGTAEGKPVFIKSFTPLDSSGQPYDSKIPFMFVGAEENTPKMQKAPMDDLCEIACGHFRNSADYEESIYYCGQPTLVLSGLNEDWVTNQLKGKVFFGSRSAVPLPKDASAALLEPQPNQLVSQAMQEKEKQMVAIGAKMVQEVHASRTATETMINTTSESSSLANIADNVSDAIEWALGWCRSFLTTDPVTDPINAGEADSEGKTDIKYRLNKEFDLNQMTAEQRAESVKEWEAGAITFGEMRAQLRRGGIATQDDDEAQTEIAKELAAQPQPIVVLPAGAAPNAEAPPIGGAPAPAKPAAGGAPAASA